MKPLALLLLCALPVAATWSGEIYRWVDPDGVTHFTQDPPHGQPFKKITPDVMPATPAPSVDRLRNSQNAAASAEADSSKTREAGLKLKAETLERCAKARDRTTFLQDKTARRLFRVGPDGQEVRYTDEEFAAELQKSQTEADQNCS